MTFTIIVNDVDTESGETIFMVQIEGKGQKIFSKGDEYLMRLSRETYDVVSSIESENTINHKITKGFFTYVKLVIRKHFLSLNT